MKLEEQEELGERDEPILSSGGHSHHKEGDQTKS